MLKSGIVFFTESLKTIQMQNIHTLLKIKSTQEQERLSEEKR